MRARLREKGPVAYLNNNSKIPRSTKVDPKRELCCSHFLPSSRLANIEIIDPTRNGFSVSDWLIASSLLRESQPGANPGNAEPAIQ